MRLNDEHRRSLGLGLSGAHRTGKTTVAKHLAEHNGCPFVASSVSQIAREMGLKPDIGMTNGDRAVFQEEVLRRAEVEYEKQNGLFISDRTPLDFAAYALTEWHPSRSTPENDAWVLDYVRRCMDATGRYFFLVATIQPGILYKAEEGKPDPNELYQELMNTTIIGLGSDPAVECHYFTMPRDVLDTETRSKICAQSYAHKINEYTDFLEDVLPAMQ